MRTLGAAVFRLAVYRNVVYHDGSSVGVCVCVCVSMSADYLAPKVQSATSATAVRIADSSYEDGVYTVAVWAMASSEETGKGLSSTEHWLQLASTAIEARLLTIFYAAALS